MRHISLIRGLVILLGLSFVAQVGPRDVPAQPATDYAAVDHATIECATLLVFGEPIVTDDLGEVECGVVQVPENWSRPGGRLLDITYVTLKSTSPDPAPDPLVYLEGGPGGSALLGLESYAATFAGPRATRDVILFDQRGTQFSSPLECSTFTVAELLGGVEAVDGEMVASPIAAEPAVIGGGLLPRSDTAVMLDEARLAGADGAASCVSQLLATGVDLRQYNSIASSRDLMALLGALGIDHYNLYGLSYGTRLALVVMRDHGDSGLRSVVLDSTFPPEIRGFEVFPAEAHEVVIQLFADCSLDPVCGEAYPDLKRRFIVLLDRLKTDPIETAAGQTVSAIDVVYLMAGISQTIPAVPYIPLMIAELEQGDTTTYDGIVSGALFGFDYHDILSELGGTDEVDAQGTPVAVDPFAVIPEIGLSGEPLSLAELFISSVEVRARAMPEQAQDAVIFLLTSLDQLPRTETILREFVERTFTDETVTRDRAALLGIINQMEPDDVQEVFRIMEGAVTLLDVLLIGMNRAVFNSVECNEEIPFEQFEQTVAAAEQLEIPELAHGVLEVMALQFATCEVWPSGRAPEIEALPVTSDVPTLILAGAYDQQTPVSWNKLAFVNLPNAYFVEFPMSGHGVISYSSCAADVVSQFVEQPSAEPDSTCVADLKPVWVLAGQAVPAATPVAEPRS